MPSFPIQVKFQQDPTQLHQLLTETLLIDKKRVDIMKKLEKMRLAIAPTFKENIEDPFTNAGGTPKTMIKDMSFFLLIGLKFLQFVWQVYSLSDGHMKTKPFYHTQGQFFNKNKT